MLLLLYFVDTIVYCLKIYKCNMGLRSN